MNNIVKQADWKYINEYRRYKGNNYQLYMNGEWKDINLNSK